MSRVRPLLGAVLVIVAITLPPALYLVNPALPYLADPLQGLWAGKRLARIPPAVNLEGLESEVKVVWDRWGVPHIYASSEEDLFRVEGWVHASLRLFQMDLYRRVAEGRLSELVGEKGLETDVFIRTLGLHRAIDASLRLMEEKAASDPNVAATLRALEAYAEGVNAYILWAKRTGSLPVEYRLLGADPEPWTVKDSLAIAKLLSLMLSYDDSDVMRYFLVEKFGIQVLFDVGAVRGDAHTPIILRPEESRAAVSLFQGTEFAYDLKYVNPYMYAQRRVPSSLALEPLSLKPAALEPRWLRDARLAAVSNNWVVSGRLTSTGRPILANDPHLQLTAPPIWAEVYLDSPTYRAYGVTVPGVPFVIIGRGEHVAWGFTNSFIDVVDWYYYKWSGGRYYYKGEWLKPSERTEVIKVRESRGYKEVTITVRETVHGPLIDFNTSRGVYRLAVKWVGLQPSLVAVWAYLAPKSRDIYDFIRAQRYFDSPIQNAVIADDRGNIAYSPTGLIPVRDPLPVIREGDVSLVNWGLLPFNGSAGEGEWVAYVSFPYIPRLVNPSWGYVATANNRILPYGAYPFELQSFYCDHYRHSRIVQMITEAPGKISPDYVKRMQLDVKSLAMEDVVPLLVELARRAPGSSQYKEILDGLEKWDHVMDAGSPWPAIAYYWAYIFHSRLWAPIFESLGLEYDYCVAKAEYTVQLLRKALSGDEDVAERYGVTPEAALEALKEALGKLEEQMGPDRAAWEWGRVHYYKFKHPLGSVAILGWLNYPSRPAPGDSFTVNLAPKMDLDNPEVDKGPSVRFIATMAWEVWGYIALPGGESGVPFSQHYTDLFLQWAAGEYRVIEPSPEPAAVTVFRR